MGLDVALTLLVAAVVAYTLVWRAWRPWSESHVLEPNPVTIDSPGSPEWVALQDRRREIDDDPLLTDAARADLVNDWRAMAEELKPRLMGSASAPSPTRHAWGLSFWKSAQVTSVAAFALAIVLLALIGGFRQGAFDWPGRTGGTAPAATASAPGSATFARAAFAPAGVVRAVACTTASAVPKSRHHHSARASPIRAARRRRVRFIEAPRGGSTG